MRLPALALLTLTLLCPAFAAAQSTLNKCIDAQGTVTYTNQACRNAREVKTIEIDPAPLPDTPRKQPLREPTDAPAVQRPTAKPAPSPAPATITFETRVGSNKATLTGPSKQCDSLSDKLGRTLDKMDQARRKGYTLEQMNTWNAEVRELERKKQQSGCF